MRWGCGPTEALRRVGGSKELAELMAYDKLDAGGDYRVIHQIAILCWVVASAFTSKRNRKPQVEDFMAVEMHKPEEPTAGEMFAKFKKLIGWG